MEIKECAENPEAQENDERHNDDEEAISLRNLPLIDDLQYQEKEERSGTTPLEAQDDFNFCYLLQDSSQMRAADEMFFQGQIVPLRHSQHNSLSRSHSMDHYFSGESMPSGSMNSHHSTSHKLAPGNQFHSHPSPSPRILRNTLKNKNKKSLSWNVFRGGLIAAPPEIALEDLKSRCSGKKKKKMRSEKKRVKAWDMVGGCKCSVDATEIAIIKRSAASREEDNSAAAVKKSVNHRTSEWLKNLSVQGAAAAER